MSTLNSNEITEKITTRKDSYDGILHISYMKKERKPIPGTRLVHNDKFIWREKDAMWLEPKEANASTEDCIELMYSRIKRGTRFSGDLLGDKGLVKIVDNYKKWLTKNNF